MLVTDLLVESFPDILNVEFTAGMEEILDTVEEGTQNWVAAVTRFYAPFSKDLEHAEAQMRDVKTQERPTDLKCERCGEPMVIKWGRRGEFLACSQLSRVQQHQELQPRRGRQDRGREGRDHGRGVREVRQADAHALRPLRQVPRLLGLSRVQDPSRGEAGQAAASACPDCGEGEVVEKRSPHAARCSTAATATRTASSRAGTSRSRSRVPSAAPFIVEKVTKRAGTVRRCLKEDCTFREPSATRRDRDVTPLAATARCIAAAAGRCELRPGHDHRRRSRRLRGGLAARAPRRRRRPVRDASGAATEAHQTDRLGELVCSNSLPQRLARRPRSAVSRRRCARSARW